MAALTEAQYVNAPARIIKTLRAKIGANVNILKGAKCAFKNGLVVPATATTGLTHFCAAIESVDNTGGAAAAKTIAIEFAREKYLLLFANDEAAPIVDYADIGGDAYGLDDNTVSADDDSAARTRIGTPWIVVDSDDTLGQRPGVYVEVA